MAVVPMATTTLIDLEDNDGSIDATGHILESDTEQYQTGSDSADSDTGEGDPVTQEQLDKHQAQRDAFNHFLNAIDHKSTASAGDPNDGASSVHLKRSQKIIDEVRNYQQELFERALEENIIAVLDTGSGKTLIACLLVRHVLAQELVDRSKGNPPKIVFFLANSVHLVQQQARVLANNLTTEPVVFVGDYKAEVWKQSEIWLQVISRNTPVVCTPAVLQQCLDAALIQIDQISLLIFDEAHHAKRNHPYSRIIRSHYLKCLPKLRPRIFGMTASPVDSKGNIDDSIADLEELLQCKIVTTDDPSRLSFVPKPQDVKWRYRRLGPAFETDLYRFLWSRCHFLPDLKRGFIFAKEASSVLGPWCADRVWRYVIGASDHESASIIKRFEQGPMYVAIEDSEQREATLRHLQEAADCVVQHDFEIPTADSIHLSPKVLVLHEELLERYTTKPGTRAIVFVDQRYTAHVLHDCFVRLNIPNLRPGVLLGSAQDSSSLKKQEQFLDYFRAGLINLIFATSVADEGIDIPQCNLCIRFDLYKSPIQYIQSRGRARMKDSVYAHMVEEGNVNHESTVDHAMECDVYIRQYCLQLPPDRLLGRGTKLEKMITLDSSNKSFKTSSGAICDFGNCLTVLSRFVSSLYYLGAVEKETYEEEIDGTDNLFRYVVRLPILPEVGIPGARGEWKPNKQLARRSAAWNCCLLLRRKGLLDDALNSGFKKAKPENHNARLAVSAKKSAYSMMVKPSAWEEGVGEIPKKLYLSVIQFQPEKPLNKPLSTMALLTRVPLPSFPSFTIFLEDAVETKVSIESLRESFHITCEELDLLTTFTVSGVFLDVFNKTYEVDGTRLSYWLAPPLHRPIATPVRFSDVVDVAALAAITDGRIKWSAGCQVDGIWTNKFICDPRNGKYHFFSGNIVPGVSIFDPVPDTVPAIPQKRMKNIIDFSDSYWKSSKDKFFAAQYDESQPVMSAELLMTRRNFLEPGLEKERSPIRCMIAPQPLEVSRLAPDFAASCFAWPAIIHRLESYMIALEAFEKLDLLDVPADLALEAFTKDSDADEQEDQLSSEVRHGMGKNYERLEFIGDSLLKMMTTITVFNRTRCDEEGMHCRRMEILCNRRLFDVSTEKYQLHRHARTYAFNRVTWYPENLVLLRGRGAKKTPEPVKHPDMTQDLGMKTIADMSEAIIGAAVVTSQKSTDRFDLGIKAITKLVDSEDHAIVSWSQIADMYEAPEWSTKQNDVQANKLAKDVEARTDYRFKNPRLLRSAFTHSSDINATVPDLQRLEFLGDAVLDWVSINWLFNTNPDRNPQWLTEHKMAMVSNKFLAALAVVLDFDKFLYCSTTKLYADITFYAKRIREAYVEKDVKPDFWTEIDSPPKALADLVESYLGAVLVDSGFNYEEIEKFFSQHILWFFRDISRYDNFANRHPTTYLYKKVTDEFKCRDFAVISSGPEESDNQVEFKITAGVLIHNRVIADSSGTSARYARVRASRKALTKLEGIGIEEFRKTFGCYCKMKGE